MKIRLVFSESGKILASCGDEDAKGRFLAVENIDVTADAIYCVDKYKEYIKLNPSKATAKMTRIYTLKEEDDSLKDSLSSMETI
jgi:hypothetical protein